MKNNLKNKVVLITGAAGSVGSELARQIYKMEPKNLLLLDNNETGLFDIWDELPNAIPILGDISYKHIIDSSFKEFKPQVIFHTAAYKHVKMGELFPNEFLWNNVVGTSNILSQKFEKMVFISTDKAVDADCWMGKTKKRCEELCLKTDNVVAVRFGNVLGSRGSLIPIWQKQIDEGRNITVTDKRMKRFFMSMEEACSLILEVSKIEGKGKIAILDMGEPKSILELAKEILKKRNNNKLGIDFIGKQPGEKLEEKLMTEEERKIAKKVGKLWIINTKQLEKKNTG